MGFVFKMELGPVLKSDVQSRDKGSEQLHPKSDLFDTHCPCSGSQLTHDVPIGTELMEGLLEIPCLLV